MKKRVQRLAVLTMIIVLLCEFNTPALNIDYKAIYTSDKYSQAVNETIEQLASEFSELAELKTIGYSTVGKRPLYCIKIGNGKKAILINGAHHARESMTSLIVLAQLNNLCHKYAENEYYKGTSVRELLNTVSIYFVPLVNPDGVDLAMNGGKPSWKANGRGVDLNRNYPTSKGTTLSRKSPGSEGYNGTKPFSEDETLALKALCEAVNFEASIAYHSAGEIIYWWWHQSGKCYTDSLKILNEIEEITDYQPVSSQQSGGGLGFKDWFVEKFNKPGFTLEIGTIANRKPLAWWEFERAYNKNKDVPLLLIDELIRMNTFDTYVELGGKVKTLNRYNYNLIALKDLSSLYNIKFSVSKEIITLEKDAISAKLVYHSNKALINDKEVEMPLPVVLRNNTTYIPLSFINTYIQTCKKAKELSEEEVNKEEANKEEANKEEVNKEEATKEQEIENQEIQNEVISSEMPAKL